MIKEGIINIRKPAGMSSHDVVYMVRKLTGIKRIGHTGTLDPEAFGVLPVCIGKAARLPDYLDQDFKTYRCSMYLGMSSDSQDIWGKEVKDMHESWRGRPELSEEKIRETLESFRGVISQVPPKYSAVRVDGRRLYDYARKGQDVKIPERTVYIADIRLLETDREQLKVTFDVKCTKGTYIRTICHEAGKKLGCGAAMCALERTESGYFSLENGVDFEAVKALAERRIALVDSLPKTRKMPRGRMNDRMILEGGLDALKELYGVEEPLPQQLYAEYAAIEDEINKMVIMPEEAMIHFGKCRILEDKTAKWFLQGGHVKMSEVNTLEEPEFAAKDFPLPMRDEYRRAYRLYAPEGGNYSGAFLGVAFYDLGYKKLVADKIFFNED